MTATQTISGTLQLAKTTESGKTVEVYYTNAGPMGQRFEVLVDGVSGGRVGGPQSIKVGNSPRTAQSVTVIAWGGQFIRLTAEEVRALGGIDAPVKPSPAPRCRVCGGPVRMSEMHARRGYCGCEGA